MPCLVSWAYIASFIVLVGVRIVSSDADPDYMPQVCGRVCPLSKCTRCPSVEELQSPGVGLALETSHGATVVRLHDGTYQLIALIEGDPSYTLVLSDLATGPSDRTPDHLDSPWEKWQYVKRRMTRHLNKLLGRPATPETAALAAMVSNLWNATRLWLGNEHSVTAAVLSSPDRIQLTDEETNDIFDYLRITNLMADPYIWQDLYATSAAYAGYGKGLCPTYTDAYACEQEECYLPNQGVLHVDLNRESLSGTIRDIRSVPGGSRRVQFVDFDLGYTHEEVRQAKENTSQGSSEKDSTLYWATVSARIRELVSSYRGTIDQLLLTGPSATNPQFKAALRTALYDLVGDEVLVILDDAHSGSENEDYWKDLFSFATARGAAEIAKRMQEGPVNCAQTDECRQRREDQQWPALRVQGSDVLALEYRNAKCLTNLPNKHFVGQVLL